MIGWLSPQLNDYVGYASRFQVVGALLLIVSFATESLRDCCASSERAEAAFGTTYAKELITILADAEAVDTAAELIELYHPNVIVEASTITLTSGTQFRLTFTPVGQGLDPDKVDWSAVRRLKMKDVSIC